MRSDRKRLLDMQDAIEQIGKYAEDTRQRLEQEELIQVWMIHHLQILGEAARAVSDEFKAEHPALGSYYRDASHSGS